MQLLRLIQNCERALLILVLVMQIPFTVLTFMNKNYTLSASDNTTIAQIQTLARKQYIRTFVPWDYTCKDTTVVVNNQTYCVTRYTGDYSKIIGHTSDCPADHPFLQVNFSTPDWFFCFKTEYTTVVCDTSDKNLPCYNCSEQTFPLQDITSSTSLLLNRYIGNNSLSINCDNLQQLNSLMISPIQNYYESLNSGLLISWFINLAIVAIMVIALGIGYVFKVQGSQVIVDKVLLVTTILSMLILSIMGLILSIQRFEIGLVSDNIHSYAGCFASGPQKDYISGFPYLYGNLMDGYALFLLVMALILFVLVIFDLVMQLFKKSYISGSQISSSNDQYMQLQELPKKGSLQSVNFD